MTPFAPSFAPDYWIDTSCLPHPAVARALAEALHMASKTDARLGTDDADIQAAFQQIYNTNTGDATAVSEVRRIMSDISRMKPTADFETSDLRIYCDKDNRWRLQEDKKNNKRALSPNSKRKQEDQVCVDKSNDIFCKGPPGCKDSDTIAEVFDNLLPDHPMQNDRRAVMTFCEPYVSAAIATIGEQTNTNFTKAKLTENTLGALLNVTLMHELTHIPELDSEYYFLFFASETRALTAIPCSSRYDPAYGWKDIIVKTLPMLSKTQRSMVCLQIRFSSAHAKPWLLSILRSSLHSRQQRLQAR